MTVATAAPAREASKAYRTELSPVSFLRRSAYVYPDKVAVVHGERRITYRQLRDDASVARDCPRPTERDERRGAVVIVDQGFMVG